MDSQNDDDCQPPAKLHIYIQWHEEQERFRADRITLISFDVILQRSKKKQQKSQ